MTCGQRSRTTAGKGGDAAADRVTEFQTGNDAVAALSSGKVDCVIIDNEPAKSYVAATSGLKVLDTEYVSEDYALSYYGMIPETPAVVTSITRSRSRHFNTPFGVFSYRYCRSQAYPVGITAVGEDQNRFLIATPEKALFDKIAYDRRFEGDDPEAYLLEDLRLDEESLRRLNKTRLKELAPFMTGRLKSIYNYLEELR